MGSKQGLRVAIVGATGAVGREMLQVLAERKFPVKEIVAFASSRSVGKAVEFEGTSYRCQVMTPGCFNKIDVAFFDAADAISKEWAPRAAEEGAWVIDNSATFRMESDIPLVVPQVNAAALGSRLQKKAADLAPRERIIAGPNCSTVQLVMALRPLHEKFGLKRVVVSSYQSTSGAGSAAMEELSAQTVGMFNQREVPAKAFTHQIAFNCIPHIGGFKDDGYTSEERKIMDESKKILGLPSLRITATAVRVPTFSCHGESVNMEFEKPLTAAAARDALEAFSGIVVQDEPSKNIYPLNAAFSEDEVEPATGRDEVFVGRIRKDPSLENGLNLWVVSDNLRKGAATNAIEIGEKLIEAGVLVPRS